MNIESGFFMDFNQNKKTKSIGSTVVLHLFSLQTMKFERVHLYLRVQNQKHEKTNISRHFSLYFSSNRAIGGNRLKILPSARPQLQPKHSNSQKHYWS